MVTLSIFPHLSFSREQKIFCCSCINSQWKYSWNSENCWISHSWEAHTFIIEMAFYVYRTPSGWRGLVCSEYAFSTLHHLYLQQALFQKINRYTRPTRFEHGPRCRVWVSNTLLLSVKDNLVTHQCSEECTRIPRRIAGFPPCCLLWWRSVSQRICYCREVASPRTPDWWFIEGTPWWIDQCG